MEPTDCSCLTNLEKFITSTNTSLPEHLRCCPSESCLFEDYSKHILSLSIIIDQTIDDRELLQIINPYKKCIFSEVDNLSPCGGDAIARKGDFSFFICKDCSKIRSRIKSVRSSLARIKLNIQSLRKLNKLLTVGSKPLYELVAEVIVSRYPDANLFYYKQKLCSHIKSMDIREYYLYHNYGLYDTSDIEDVTLARRCSNNVVTSVCDGAFEGEFCINLLLQNIRSKATDEKAIRELPGFKEMIRSRAARKRCYN